MLRAKLKGEVEQADYEQANVEFTREVAGVGRELREIEPAQATTDAFLRFAGKQLLDVEGVWQMATQNKGCAFEISYSRTVYRAFFSEHLQLMSLHFVGGDDSEKEVMVRPERFELPTCCSGGNRSIQLSYGRTDHYSLHG